MLSADVLFDFGSAVVKAEGVHQLQKLARQLSGSTKAQCDGHTDNVGGTTFDQQLGLDRAKAVCAIIKTHVRKTAVRSFGETRPVASNATEGGRARNRRVEVTIFN